MLYIPKISKATSCLFSVLLVFVYSSLQASELEKYEQWKAAVTSPENSVKVFSFFYNNPHWPLFNESVRIAEKHIDKSVPTDLILKWFRKYPPKTSEGLFAHINCMLGKNQKKTESYIRQTWIYQNMSDKLAKQYYSKFKDYITPQEEAKKAKHLSINMMIDQLKAMKEFACKKVAKYIDKFIAQFKTKHSIKYQDSDLQDIDQKCIIVQNLIDNKKYLKAAEILAKSNENEDKHMDTFYKIRRFLSFNFVRDGNPELAYDVIRLYKINSKTKDERIAKAEWLLGYLSYRFLDMPDLAIKHFEKAYNNSKKTIRLSKNAFWLANVHKKVGNVVFAIDWFRKAGRYNSTFYGYLANSYLEKINQNKNEAMNDVMEFFASEIIFDNRELVRILKTITDRSMIEHFYLQLVKEIDDPVEEELLIEMAQNNDELDAVLTEEDHKQHYSVSDKIYKTLDQNDMKLVNRINNDVCFSCLVHAIIQRESHFKQNAKSNAGAIGLMQILPSTAKYEAKKIKFKIGGDSLYDRKRNLTIGSFIVNRLLDKYDQNIVFAIAAYNCGEGNIAKYQKSIKKLKGLSALDLIELIPIKETRLYVKHVLRGFFYYLKKFNVKNCYDCEQIIQKVKMN